MSPRTACCSSRSPRRSCRSRSGWSSSTRSRSSRSPSCSSSCLHWAARRSRRASARRVGVLDGRGDAHLLGRHAGAQRGRQPPASGRVDGRPDGPADDLADRRQRLDRRHVRRRAGAGGREAVGPRRVRGGRVLAHTRRPGRPGVLRGRRSARRRTGHRRQGRCRRLVRGGLLRAAPRALRGRSEPRHRRRHLLRARGRRVEAAVRHGQPGSRAHSARTGGVATWT